MRRYARLGIASGVVSLACGITYVKYRFSLSEDVTFHVSLILSSLLLGYAMLIVPALRLGWNNTIRSGLKQMARRRRPYDDDLSDEWKS